jgi:hypothetical protein
MSANEAMKFSASARLL